MANDLIDLGLSSLKYVAAAGGAAIVLKGAFFTVAQQTEGLVSRFGKYTGAPRTTGLNVKIPFVDKVDARISTALLALDAKLDSKTQDEQFVQLPISIQFEIKDTAKYYYKSRNANEQIKNIVSAEVRKYANTKDFNQLYSDREEISDAVIQSVSRDMDDYGVQLRRIVIDEPEPDANTKQAYNDVRASERRRDAARNNAEAKKIEMVETAKADKERNELIGQGIKSFRKAVAESYIETRKALIDAGVDEVAADTFMAEAMRLDTMRDIGERGNLVVMALESKGSDGASVMAQVIAAQKAGSAQKPANEQDNAVAGPSAAAAGPA